MVACYYIHFRDEGNQEFKEFPSKLLVNTRRNLTSPF